MVLGDVSLTRRLILTLETRMGERPKKRSGINAPPPSKLVPRLQVFARRPPLFHVSLENTRWGVGTGSGVETLPFCNFI